MSASAPQAPAGVQVGDKPNQSPTERAMNGRDMIGVKNITNAAHPLRGTTFPIDFGDGRITTIAPGHAAPIPRSIWEKIGGNRDCHGQLCFKEVSLSECDHHAIYEVSNYTPNSNSANEVSIDEATMSNVDSLITIKMYSEAVDLVNACMSKHTLQVLMQRYNTREDIPLEHRQAVAKACVARISFLSKRD
jgi:hypothetical protein